MMPKFLLIFLIPVTALGAAANTATYPLEQTAVGEAAEYYQEENWSAALAQFESIAARASNPGCAATARFYAGECSLQLGHNSAAKKSYQQVLNAPAGAKYHPRSAFRLGEIAQLTGNTADAKFALRRFLSEYPDDPLATIANTLLGDIATEIGHSAEAIAHYQAAINRETEGSPASQARLGMAKVFLASGQSNQVAIALGSLTQSDDADIKLPALLLRGRAEYDAEQYERSLKTFRLASQISAATPYVYRARLAAGWSLWKLARYEEIITEVGPVPSDPLLASEYHYLLGMGAYSSQDWTTAIEEFTQSVGEVSSSFQGAALFYLGECCLQSEQYLQAKNWMRKLIDDHGDSPWADDAVWSLCQLARKSSDRADFVQASALLRSQYPSSDYLRLLDAEPWGEDSREGLPANAASITRVFEEAVGLERDGYHNEALAAYAEFVAAGEAKSLVPEALWRSARLHARLKQKIEAASDYQQILADFPSFERSADAMLHLARIETELGKPTLAKKLHKEVLEKFPQSPQADEAAYWLALAAADVKDSETAHRYVEAILKSWDQSKVDVSDRRKLLRLQALCLKCQLAAGENSWKVIRNVLSDYDWDSELGAVSTRLAYWEAEADFRLGGYSTARQKFEDIQLLIVGLSEPWIPMVPLRQAQLSARRQQWKHVLKFVEMIDESYPEFELAYEADYLRGRALAGIGQMTEARGAYKEVLQNGLANGLETAAIAQWMIGETYFHQHDYENAQSAYRHVMLEHDFPEWQARAGLQAGKCAELEGRWQEAVEFYQQALENWNDSEVADQLTGRLEWAQRQAALNATEMRK